MPTNDSEYYRAYYIANRDRIRAIRRVYYLRNAEKLKAYQKNYYRTVILPEKKRKRAKQRRGNGTSGSSAPVQESVRPLREDNNDGSRDSAEVGGE